MDISEIDIESITPEAFKIFWSNWLENKGAYELLIKQRDSEIEQLKSRINELENKSIVFK